MKTKPQKKKKRREQITVQVPPETADQFFAACELMGMTMSRELHRYMVSVIRQAEREDGERLRDLAEGHRAEKEENRRLNLGKGSKRRRSIGDE